MRAPLSESRAVDPKIVRAVRSRRDADPNAFARFGLFLIGDLEPDALREALSRLPEALDDCLAEVVVMLDRRSRDDLPPVEALVGGRRLRLSYHRPPRDAVGVGAACKGAFEYTRLRSFDHAIVMRADGTHPPERVPELIAAALEDPRRLLVGARRGRARFGEGVARALQNRILGLRRRDYASSFRAYPAEALERIPFQLDADDDLFTAEIAIQFRALGLPVVELPLLEAARADSETEGRGLATAIAYRLHQVHATRDGRFLVDHDIHYTLKLSPTGSHMQIVDAIRPETRVLDLGCSQGLLARPLREKQVEVTGVDRGPGRRLARELAAYHRHDLEEALDLDLERDFDYVVVADVIEHLRSRTQLLRSARRYLKEDGRLIISTPNIALWFYRLSLLVGRFEYGPRGVLDETHVHLFTGATFRREVEKAGFHVLSQRVTALPFEVVFESTGRSRLVRFLADSYHRLARWWPSMFAYQYILEAEITTLDEQSTAREAEPVPLADVSARH